MIFVDAGFYAGNALMKYINKGMVDKSWTIYAFEPNPELPIEDTVKWFKPLKIKLFKKAVWTKNEKLTFHIAGREDAAGIADLTGHTDPTEVTVQAIDFSKFVAGLPQVDICSMDIEGAEFVVLEKMIADGSIDKIKILDIEFHHRFMNDYTHKDADRLIRKLRKRGLNVRLKVPTT